MKRPGVLFVALLFLATAVHAAIVDRVAVSLANKVITTSEIEERIRLTALQNSSPPDFTAASWKESAERLIDQKLVQREMLVGRYAVMEDEDSATLLAQYSKEHYPSDQAFHDALHQYQLTPDQLQQDLARQSDLLTFLTLRFRPAVQVAEEDVRNYYRDNIAPHNTPEKTVTLNEVRGAIEEILTNQRADKELDAWLKDQRKRIKVDYHAEAFPPGAIPVKAGGSQ